MEILASLILSTAAVLISAYLIPGAYVDGPVSALVVAVVLGIVNAIIKPIISLLALPVTILTLGLFSFVISALMVLLTDSLVAGFHIEGFWTALLFAVVLGLLNMLFGVNKKSK